MSAERCPECGVDIATMDLPTFVEHQRIEHPDAYEMFRRVFISFTEESDA